MQSFQRETFEIDGDSDVAPARVHPGNPNYVVVPVRWLRNQRSWMESRGLVIRLDDGDCLVGYSWGHHFGDLMHLCLAEITRAVGEAWPTFVELVANSARGDFSSPSLHRVPDPDTFCTPHSEMTFVGVAVQRVPGVRTDEFGSLVMNRLYDLVDVCLAIHEEIGVGSLPVAARRTRRLVPRPRPGAPNAAFTGTGRLMDVAHRLHVGG